MSDPQPQTTLISEVWVVQDPPADPPIARVGPYPDENTAVSEGVVQLNSDATWTAFTILRTYRLQQESP
jgi:hypothetical protein